MNITAKEILGNNNDHCNFPWRLQKNIKEDLQPSIEEIKEDLKILSAIGYRILRTYNVHFAHASNLF